MNIPTEISAPVRRQVRNWSVLLPVTSVVRIVQLRLAGRSVPAIH